MWTKVIGCMLLTIFLNRDAIGGSVAPGPYTIHRHVEPGDNINISKNITIHRRGFGRFLGLLKLLKGIKNFVLPSFFTYETTFHQAYIITNDKCTIHT